MATFTAAEDEVKPGTGCEYTTYLSGEPFAAGAILYLKAADGLVYKADCSTSEKGTLLGVALNSVKVAGQPVAVATAGVVQIDDDGSLTLGKTLYCDTGTAGIYNDSPPTSGSKFISVIGLVVSTNNLQIGINNSGVQCAA